MVFYWTFIKEKFRILKIQQIFRISLVCKKCEKPVECSACAVGCKNANGSCSKNARISHKPLVGISQNLTERYFRKHLSVWLQKNWDLTEEIVNNLVFLQQRVAKNPSVKMLF